MSPPTSKWSLPSLSPNSSTSGPGGHLRRQGPGRGHQEGLPDRLGRIHQLGAPQGRGDLPRRAADGHLLHRGAGRGGQDLDDRPPAGLDRRVPPGVPSPTDDVERQAVWAGIRHEHGTAPDVAEPISVELLRAMIAKLPPTARGKRDHALLLIGFAAALRRSELVALDRSDVAERRRGPGGSNVRRSKTDQEGAGRRVGVPYGSTPATCPVRALETWCQAARIEEGPLFLTFDRRGRITPNRLHPSAVNRVVQRSVAATGVSSADYSAHSLRAGLATAAAAAGVSERAIMAQTAIAASPWPGVTSGKDHCSGRTQPPNWGSDTWVPSRPDVEGDAPRRLSAPPRPRPLKLEDYRLSELVPPVRVLEGIELVERMPEAGLASEVEVAVLGNRLTPAPSVEEVGKHDDVPDGGCCRSGRPPTRARRALCARRCCSIQTSPATVPEAVVYRDRPLRALCSCLTFAAYGPPSPNAAGFVVDRLVQVGPRVRDLAPSR